ncbi:uncharacterized protein [Epargyreus clarus]|uniref:uncharacterized protein n=1 Tax=Epargyreus clarus TaxID=520877 RepID=UPI003C307406
MYMFQSVLETVPKTRSQLVNELEIPEDISVTPYVWAEPEESLTRSDSLPSVSVDELVYEVNTVSTDSSLALSRAMTDSEIDYERYRRLKSRSFSDPWVQMRAALDAFPREYLDSLNSFQNTSSEVTPVTEPEVRRHRYNEELRLKMERFFEEECRVFTPEDPGALALEDALQELDLKDTDLDSSTE